MTRTRYAMSDRPQDKLYMQREMARLAGKDVHRWVFAHSIAPDVESLVRKWLTVRLDNTPPLHRTDEATNVNYDGLTPREAAKALIKATRLDNVEGGAV